MLTVKKLVNSVGLLFAMSIGWAAAAEELVTPVDELQRGMPSTVQGTVVRFTDDDSFRLKDSTGTVNVYIGWRNRVDLSPGETVTVEGVVDDDLLSVGRAEIYAHRIARADDSAIKLRH